MWSRLLVPVSKCFPWHFGPTEGDLRRTTPGQGGVAVVESAGNKHGRHVQMCQQADMVLIWLTALSDKNLLS